MKTKSLIVDEEGYIALQKQLVKDNGGTLSDKGEHLLREQFKRNHKNGSVEVAPYMYDMSLRKMKDVIAETGHPWGESTMEYFYL